MKPSRSTPPAGSFIKQKIVQTVFCTDSYPLGAINLPTVDCCRLSRSAICPVQTLLMLVNKLSLSANGSKSNGLTCATSIHFKTNCDCKAPTSAPRGSLEAKVCGLGETSFI